MNKNLEPGCLAYITKSINKDHIGKIVQCIKDVGEHPLLGKMWRVSAKEKEFLVNGVMTNTASWPQDWLKKVLPPPIKPKEKQVFKPKELETIE